MRLSNASLLLVAAAALLSSTQQTSTLFAAAQHSSSKPRSCPGGATPDSDGSCPNPDMIEESSSSSDDEDHSGQSGNPNAHRMEEGEDKPPTTCDSYLRLSGFKDAVYETRSFYQEVAWSENANKPDVCMSLDDILQICHSYRPHYHEPYVHFPAAYLKEMKRIVFIGGGDAMLLHETLKYPNVELVLGLELDQKVVRESLKHFHIQPHFDDPRVQWWFGDASKSLALIPREWFGTFDLVMVDLSETAMSISVTDDLDIFGALSLLMKPDGIFVKNELYYGQMSKLFDHSTFVYMTDYPILCDQDWAMGSNSIDFMHPKIDGGHMETNKIHTFEYTPLDDEDDHYKLMKDYSRNDARKQGKCDIYDREMKERAANGGELMKKNLVVPTKSAGVLLVVEAEGVKDFSGLAGALKDILTKQGLKPIGDVAGSSSTTDGFEATSGIFLAMEEGYVDAHYYPGKSYVGFEIVLWSKIAKNSDVRDAILEQLEVTSNFSNFRVIHGGMLGAKNWKEDVEAVGPVNKNLRQCDPEVKAAEPQIGSSPIPADTFNSAVAASLMLLPKKMDKVVAVICGSESNECETAKSLVMNPKVDKVVALWDCGVTKDSSKDDDEFSNVSVCGAKELKRSAKIEEGYSAVVIDPSANESFVLNMKDELCRRKDAGQHVLLRDQVAFFTSLANEAEATLYATCVKNLLKEFVRSARIVIDGVAQFGMIGTNNHSFVRRVVGVQQSIEKKTGQRTHIEKMVGGPVKQQKQYDPDHYPPNAYNESESLKQYTNQSPLASQSLYQLELSDPKDIKKMSPKLIKDAVDSVIKPLKTVFPDAQRVDFSTEVGIGAVSAVLSAAGHLVVIWDGAGRLTVNILTDGESYVPVVIKDPDVPDMQLSSHKTNIVDPLILRLPLSTGVSVREQMPRGANKTVNFKKDIDAIPNCTDHYVLCKDFFKEDECDNEEEKPWMEKYCSLSCGTCDKMWMGGPPPLA